MTRYWTAHWQNRLWRPEVNREGEAVSYCGSDLLRRRGVSPSDSLYIISLADGHLMLGGRMTVRRIVSHLEAMRLLRV
jgi:hypothetical protein